MDDTDIQTLLTHLREQGADRLDVEVKAASKGTPSLAETLSAFGNLPGGGLIILGLDERAGFAASGLTGVPAHMAAISSPARNVVHPPVLVDFDEVMVDGQTTLFVTVREVATYEKPCRVRGVAYLRQADGDYRMSDAEMGQVIAARTRPRFDIERVEGTSTERLDDVLTRDFVGNARAASVRLSDASTTEILARKSVVTGDVLTVAGLYALGDYPQQFSPSLSITAAVRGRDVERTRDLVHLDGPLPDLLDRAVDWVRRNTRSEVRFGVDGHGRDYDELPLVAVRELIANALVHRDLSVHTSGKRVEIRLTDDHLIISNPGGLWGIRTEQLGTPSGKSAVNEHLYEICKLVRTRDQKRVIEGEGGGIRAVLEALDAAGLPRPRFLDSGVAFTVLVPRHALMPTSDLTWLAGVLGGRRLDPTESSILVGMRHGERWTNPDVRRRFGLGTIEARGALQRLVQEGWAVASGRGRGTSYVIRPDLAQNGDSSRPSVSILRSSSDRVAGQDELPWVETTAQVSTNDLIATTRHGPAVWRAMGEAGGTRSRIVELTGLSSSQVHYALTRLRSMGLLDVTGGWGVHTTTYRRAR